MGWSVQETVSEVRLIPAGAQGADIDSVFGSENGADEPEPGEASGTTFALEYQLRDFIAQNIGAIEVNGKRLRIYVDPAEREGVEFPTAVGPIDILAVDDTGAFFVFELKRARSPDHAIGQLTRYMGWVKHTIGKDVDVHGVIVAREISQTLRYAVSVIPNISLFEYEVEFHLRSAHDVSSGR